jgi:hypothetical protein
MIFDASHALRFINRARAAIGLPALTELSFTGAVRVDERACLLARALEAEVGGSADPRFSDHLVMRLGDQALARAVAAWTGQPCNDRGEVPLPEALSRLAAAFDCGRVERRGARYVPAGQLSFDDLCSAEHRDDAAPSSTTSSRDSAADRGHRAPQPTAPQKRRGSGVPIVEGVTRPAPAPAEPGRRRAGVGCRRPALREQAFTPVHHHTISAAHGAGPAVSGPGRNGRRSGRVVPKLDPNGMPPTRPLRPHPAARDPRTGPVELPRLTRLAP